MPIFPEAFQVVAVINAFWHVFRSLNSIYLQLITQNDFLQICIWTFMSNAYRATNIPVTKIGKSARSIRILAT